MKINCLGGGPAGLYFAILMKKADPRNDITVFERNAPDDTFGWGVVFSDETLGNIEAADAPSFAEITRTFARWTTIDVRYRGEVIRSRGHGFCGISRKRLLQILQQRAQELGVELRFKTEIADVDALRRDSDLLVAGDGLNSVTRNRYASAFEPSLDVRKARYIWLGTPQLFDAFTFSFRENEHGLFQVHAYRFDEKTSTFIVECDEQTWKNAGLDKASEEESRRYCEKVFAADLGGNPLLGNRSSWIRFTTVRNKTWHHENVVLLGDAAHTAHFSIGSGTKLAFEDAIALADACRNTKDVPTALSEYEQARRPMAERIQRAAQESLQWFEGTKRYQHLDPLQLTFSLMSRSLRIGRDNLRVRDPELVDRLDRDFAKSQGVSVAQTQSPPPPMFLPLTLRGLRLENRVAVSPMCMYSAQNGTPNDFHLVHLGSRAIGGAGLVIAEMTAVSEDGRITPGCTGIYDEAHVAAWKRITDFVHTQSKAKIALQLGHAGRKGSTKSLWEGADQPLETGNWPLIAPSPIAWSERNQVPREMTRADMDRVRDDYVRAAKYAERAGFDMLEVHFAHGYLLSSFLSPLSNVRTDAYGGSLENRLRFPLEVFDAVRAAWPADKPISVRISATDWAPGGFTDDDAVEVARVLAAHGCDIVDVSSGQTSREAKPAFGRMWQTRFADRVRQEARTKTMAVGAIAGYDDVNSILLAGRADLCLIARGHLEDPYFTLHAAKAQGYDDVYWPPQYLLAKTLPRVLPK